MSLPAGWAATSLGEVVEILDNRRVPINAEERELRQGPIPYYGATGQVGWIDDFLFDEELVLLGEDGAPFLDSSKAKAYMIKGKSWVNNHAHVLRGKLGLSNRFLLHQLNIVDYHPHVSGSTRLKLPQAPMREIELKVAPQAEQDRIVAEIEKQFTRLDDAVAALKRVQANLKRYRASVLKAACEGRLVPTEAELARNEGRSYEPASELLKRILSERRAKWEADQLQKMIAASKPPKDNEWKQKYKEPQPPKLSALPDLPTGWTWATLEQVTDRITDGTHLPPPFVPDGVAFIFVQHIVDGQISFKNTKFISKDTYESLNARCPVEKGDVLYTAVGSYGVAVEIKTDAPFSFQRHIAHLRRPRVVASYLAKCLNSPIVLAQAHRAARGVAQKTVTLGDLTKFVIPIPPLDEQNRIVTTVEKSAAMVEHLIQQVDQEKMRSMRLRKSTLSSAFQGKLVPQDPNDEPASVLLERIRAERAALATKNGNQKATLQAATANGQRRRRVASLAHPGRGGKGGKKMTSAVGVAQK